MDLRTVEIAARKELVGEQTDLAVAAGQRLTVETSPGGAEVLDEIVPANKLWTVSLSVKIVETDA